MAAPELKILPFRSAAEFRRWLTRYHRTCREGIWLRIHKKTSGVPSITYDEALDQALCYGWIDGQKQKGDAASWLQKFTPRRPRSGWSKRNTDHAKRLIEAGLMRAAGLEEIEAAKKDGRWKAAYSSPGKAEVPADFLKALARDKQAKAFFASLNRANVYAIAYRLETARKPETRQRRFEAILAMLSRGEKFH